MLIDQLCVAWQCRLQLLREGMEGIARRTSVRERLGHFDLACRELGYKRRQRSKVVRCFVEGYLRGLLEFARNDREKWQQQRDLFQQQTRALMLEVLTPAQRTKLEELEKQGQAQRG